MSSDCIGVGFYSGEDHLFSKVMFDSPAYL